ncbi:MAG: hypothetical protein K0Q66_2442, partial [Chitinophagaceae bacterium]|nr:hypothetical protein [Chitinophagaceae bacterium]
MKKCYSFLLAALLFSVPALANIVIVKGHITYSNGAPAANHAVWISTDSTSTPPACMQGSMVHTNANGYYIDTLYCTSGNIVKVRIQTQNCNGTWLVETPQVNTSTNLVERNFTLCTPTPAPCQANFNYHFIQNMTVQFTSLSIPTGGSSGLPPHYWNFGDGGTGTGLYPVHTYTAPGTYVVKLIISGVSCADTISRTIQVTNITGTCNATFQDSVINNKLFVFSGGSTTAPGDSIIQRLWNFGDGTGNNNNWANADHIYTAAGTYTVCLRITTALGCNDSVCRTIVVGSPTANCVSNFSYLRTNSAPLTIAFNSSSSAGTTPADAIISRTWTFGDGSPALTGNNVYPSHTYPSIGNYQACLKITTASGCQKTICKTVSVYDSSCHANFNYNIGTGGVVYFNNTSSTLGTTAQYQWMFGNGTTSTAINPVKTYSPGTYTVCLVMWSASGCVDSVCKVITIAPPPPTTNCEAVFQYVGLPPSAGSAGYTLQFGSGASHGTTSTDSIIQRTWYWDDGMMTNGLVSPTHTYMMPGVYNVCLVITSASGCSDTTCKTIAVPMQNQLVCQSYFTYEHLPTTSAATRAIRFNSTMSHGGPADSITSRKWEFGDGTILTGNVVNPIHQYATPGTYNVCLTVKTALNCEKKICKLVVIPQVAGACV